MYDKMQPGGPLDPLPDYVPPFESRSSNPELAARYPLSIVSPKPHAFLNSQYANAVDKQDVQGDQRVWIHPEDAGERGVGDGDIVRVFNDRGSFCGPAVLDDIVMKGLVMANVGHWQDKASGSTVNTITSDRHNEMGMAGVFSDNLVEVALVEDPVAAG
jgi:anaerobic selenocysteine-containing dehydrogenase